MTLRPVIKRLTEIRDNRNRQTHQMCCWCFRMIPVEDLYVDETGQRWDHCGKDETECEPVTGPLED